MSFEKLLCVPGDTCLTRASWFCDYTHSVRACFSVQGLGWIFSARDVLGNLVKIVGSHSATRTQIWLGLSTVAEYLLGMHEVLNSVSRTENNERKKGVRQINKHRCW